MIIAARFRNVVRLISGRASLSLIDSASGHVSNDLVYLRVAEIVFQREDYRAGLVLNARAESHQNDKKEKICSSQSAV